jgi:hypothetical protein
LSSAAALDPELTTPYKVQIVLRVAEHPLLTAIFKDQLQRELRDGLQGALGSMGQVEVLDQDRVPMDQWPALWKEVETKGLQRGLDGPGKGTFDTKTHFVRVDYVDGQYEIEARQYDGLTGLASPVVRRERTPDRQFVARTAALLVDRDFGLVGTIQTASDPHRVQVAFKGGKLQTPLERWVEKGDVFALVQVHAGGDGQRTMRIPWTLLQVREPPGKDGCGTCQLFQGRTRPLVEGQGIAGYRCLKLGTIDAPLRLRLVKANAPVPTPVPSLEIHVRRHGFLQDEHDKVQGTSDADGYFSTEKRNIRYHHVAFVSILHAGAVRAQVPIAIVDDQPVVCPVSISADAGSQFAVRKNFWEQGLLDELLFLADLFKDLNDSLGRPNNRQQTLDKAQKALDGLERDLDNFTRERRALGEIASSSGNKQLDLGDSRLKGVEKGREELKAFIVNLEKIVKEENDPARQKAKTMVEQARLLEEVEAEYGKAIELYEQVPLQADDAKLREHVTRLKEAWKPKDAQHAAARQFIYETWPKSPATPSAMKDLIKEAEKALEECRRVKDPLGPRRLLRAALNHSAQLAKQIEVLSPDVNEDDYKLAKQLADVLDSLARLMKDAKQAASSE